MKINPRLFPAIIIITFVLFLVAALLLGFRPVHGGENRAEQAASALIMFCERVL